MNNVATVINFCSNEYRFLSHCIAEAKKFCQTIHIALADHFFDGKKEDIAHLRYIAAEFPEAKFFLYPFFPGSFFGKKQNASTTTHMWHNAARMVSFHFLPKETNYVLFLDADEIVEGNRFAKWLNDFPYQKYEAIKLSCYWYFREPAFQSKHYETSPLFMKKTAISRKLIMQKDERTGMYTQCQGKKMEGILGMDEKPLIHHYSWVRTKEEMLRKVRSWGHKSDRDWEKLVEKEFGGPFQGKDFVHGYEFLEVAPFVNINFAAKPKKHSGETPSNFISVDPLQMLQITQGRFSALFKRRLLAKAPLLT